MKEHMALTIDQLQNGIRYWRGTDWPQDFHNNYYGHDLAAVRTDGVFNQQWWDRFFRVLHAWRATRPCSRAFLTSRAQARFEALGERWSMAVAPNLKDDIEVLEWHQVAAFPSLVAEIKDVASPVFTSKFCHFLAPRIFTIRHYRGLRIPSRGTTKTRSGQFSVNDHHLKSLTLNLARTEALYGSSEKVRIGAYRLEVYGTFCGTPLYISQQLHEG